MKSGKNLSVPNKDGWIPLHEAAYYGQVGCLSLLQKGQWSLTNYKREKKNMKKLKDQISSISILAWGCVCSFFPTSLPVY